MSVADKNCLDITAGRVNVQLSLYGCHGFGGTQFFAFTKTDQIVTTEELCVGISNDQNSVILMECDEKNAKQLWNYDEKVNIF